MLEVKDLSLELSGFRLEDISFDVQDGEYFVLVGHTGAGKSVLLEAIAGLKSIKSGRIMINGRDVTSLNLEKRNIGFAYQDYAVYRHLSVYDNITFGLMWKWKTQREIKQAVDRAVELLGIENLLTKRTTSLSGGEIQKICLARAVAIKPDLLILDEPISAIDPESKEATERELKGLHSRLGLTTIHVTHNFEEAIALGDRIAVMRAGRILQIGTPDQVFRHPNSESVARFLMTRNIFEGEVLDGYNGQGVFCVDGVRFPVATTSRGRCNISIRPEDILISRASFESENTVSLSGIVTRISDRGAIAYVTVNVPPEFTCLVLHRSLDEMGMKEGEKVFLTFKVSAVNFFEIAVG